MALGKPPPGRSTNEHTINFAPMFRFYSEPWGRGRLGLVSGCGALVPKAAPLPLVYVIDDPWVPSYGTSHDSSRDPPLPPSIGMAPIAAPTLIVHPTRAAPGFDSQHIIYVRVPHQLEHFAHADWVDTPAHMLTPLIIATVQHTGSFRAVETTDSDMDGELR